ncbi:BQ2448_1978 [Microbotryum intermedium]|uniref:BQ2448_1978 protein n=1 Tax=Microbotryum intermedium TaxID=269621 RepID=A0A238FCU1_9BASI|nr:BQ2448_1978 [Microbotryum intermedium]
MGPKVVLITGCSEGGIGNALCQAYAQAGCHVFATARRLSAMDNLSSSVDRIQLDVLNEGDCRRAVQQVVDKVGRIDILVNNAGAGGTGALMDFPVDQAKAVFDTNLFAPMRLTQLVVPHMAHKKSGLIINIGSIVGVIPTPWAGVYATSKAAIHAWSEVLRMEVKGLGIDVMVVAPGAITSGFGKKQADSFDLPKDSLYHPVAQRIMDRATMSQRADHTMPASKLAQGIVTRSIRSSPATYYTAGGKAFLFWILERLPRSIVWFVLARVLGTNQVGK